MNLANLNLRQFYAENLQVSNFLCFFVDTGGAGSHIVRSMNKQKLARKVKKLRLDNDWTLKQMADLVGLHPRTIWNIENAKVFPHDRTLARLQRCFPSLDLEEFYDPGGD